MTSILPNAPATFAADTPPVAKGHRAAVIASFLGWTLDAFDFFLLTYTLTAVAQEFGQPDKAIALTLTVTLMFRPVGAFIFGLMAERWGRKKPLMINLVFFSIIEVLTGLAPSYATFLALRALFGVGMGGEWGVGASLAMEKAPVNRRGILSGLLQQGYAFGNLLAAVCFFFVFPHWGWRPMFFIGGLPALLAVYVRSKVPESEVWERTRDVHKGLHSNFREYIHHLASHWRLFLYAVVFIATMSAIARGTQDMYPTFLKRDWSLGPERVAVINVVANVGAIAGGVLFGHFSDRIGRRRAIITALVLATIAIPLWAFSPALPLLVAGGFVMQFMVQGAWGVIPAHLNELAPDSVRGLLPGFAAQCGAAIAGTVVYIEAVLADQMTYAKAMALTAVIALVLAAVAASVGKERHGVVFGRE